MKKIFVCLIIISSTFYAQGAGNDGLSFLKFGFGARNIAMGEIGVVNSNDVTALNYNPALLSNFKSSEIVFTHNEWIQDVRSELLGASFKAFNLPFAVGLNTTTVSDIESRTKPGEPLSKFSANYFNGSLSTGFEIINDISFGMTIKYLYEGMLSDEATGWGFDFGAFYKSPVEGLVFGAAIKNLGSMNELRHDATKLPTEFSVGSLYSTPVENLKSLVTVGAEYQKYTRESGNHINVGGEFSYDNLIAIRLGYRIQSEDDARNISAGLGLMWGSLNFDYAFVPFKYNLGIAHTISIKFIF
ncbi:MAG: PorV/PorQ family protein [Ignavibacteriales bacterium]|nr:PorV/PorQ family protein [Ignavibacteriales bacterium]